MATALDGWTAEEVTDMRRRVTRRGTGPTAEVCIPYGLLDSLYVTRRLSTGEIGRLLGVSKKTVRFKLIQNRIDRRPLKEAFSVSTTHAHAVSRRGPDAVNWKGGTRKNQGYRMIYMPTHPDAEKSGGYVFEHRLVMEQVMGRPLAAGEEVHHVNEVRNDNRPENLELLTKSEHMAHHANKRHRIGHPTFGFKKGARS